MILNIDSLIRLGNPGYLMGATHYIGATYTFTHEFAAQADGDKSTSVNVAPVHPSGTRLQLLFVNRELTVIGIGTTFSKTAKRRNLVY